MWANGDGCAGEHVSSVSASERSLRWWLAGSHGFFGFLGLQGSCLHVTQLEQPLPTESGVVLGIKATMLSKWRSRGDRGP